MRKKKKGLGLLLALLCLLVGIIGARKLNVSRGAHDSCPAWATPGPAASQANAEQVDIIREELPKEETAASETTAPIPIVPEEKSYPRVRGYNEKTYKLASDLVYTYAAKQDEAGTELQATLEQLKEEDPAMGAMWQEILEYWHYVNFKLEIRAGEIPEGLPEDDSLCVVVLGFQLRPDGSMAEELAGRCETALRCLERYPDAILALTGGGTAFQNRSVTEAGAMAVWFAERGVKPEQMLIEGASLTTADNAVLTAALLREKAPQVRELLLVSSDYHLPLGCLLFEEKALLSAYGEGTKPFTVAGTAAWDSGGRFLPDTPQQQKMYLWSVADPKY